MSNLEAVERHLRTFFKGHKATIDTWPNQKKDRPHIDVLVFEPGPRTELWTYASLGGSSAMRPGRAKEFFVLAPKPDPAHVELVTMTASYHADPDPSYGLSYGHTVPIGEPVVPGSPCTHLLVSLPYLFGEELEVCDLDEFHVQILWLLPITPEELEYKKKHGLDALEERFEATELDYADLRRHSVVDRWTQ
ncbi:MAG TPA: suppressor of fused domain protein [Myxococcales bacterium]|jgi:hypothetical protein